MGCSGKMQAGVTPLTDTQICLHLQGDVKLRAGAELFSNHILQQSETGAVREAARRQFLAGPPNAPVTAGQSFLFHLSEEAIRQWLTFTNRRLSI
jgi:hypothetical protein